jgi:hypothetical protein
VGPPIFSFIFSPKTHIIPIGTFTLMGGSMAENEENNGIFDMDELLDFITEETTTLQTFIYDNCIDEADKEDQMKMAVKKTVKKTIEHITSEIFLHFRDEICKIKEEYSQKLIEEQQKILDRYSAVINKIIQ